MWANFFRDGGFGMYPTLVFGFILVAASVLYLLRPERRHLTTLACLGVCTFGSGVLGMSVGIVTTMRYVQGVEAGEQVRMAALGVAEATSNLILALLIIVPSAILASIGAVRAARAVTGTPAAG